MRILVTGGAGFIGSHLVDRLLDLGRRVVVVDDLSSGKREQVATQARLETLDIRDGSELRRLVADFRPDAVFHLAAQSSVSVSAREPIFDAEVNVLGTLELLGACRAAGVGRFVFSSTGGALYGEVDPQRPADEDRLPRPWSPYGCAKLAAEGYLRAHAEAAGCSSIILRYANVYGPRQDPHGEAGVVAIFARRLLSKRPCTLFGRRAPGDGGCLRDYVYVDDIIEANLRALAGDLDVHEHRSAVYNLGTGVARSTSEILDRLVAEYGGTPEVEHRGRRPGDLECTLLDGRRYRERTGLTLRGLEDGLTETAAWFARNSR